MGSWSGTKLGLKVSKKDITLANQFLCCLKIDTEDGIIEEVGALSENYVPSIEGVVKSKLLGMMTELNAHFSEYINHFNGYGEQSDEEELEYGENLEENFEEDDNSPDLGLTMDSLYSLVNKLFPSAYVYLAHEEGNNTSDDYYRYEEIANPSTNQRMKKDCFYSYSLGIHVDTDDVIEEGTEVQIVEIGPSDDISMVIDWLIQEATSFGYTDLVQKLNQSK